MINNLPFRNWTILSLLLISLMLTGNLAVGQSNQPTGLAIGDTVADFQAVGVNGDTFQLSAELAHSPVVILFYRGQWCPVCSRHLRAVQDSAYLIANQGATLVAISPERPPYAAQMAQKTAVGFPLLYDEDYNIAQQFDVLFQPDKATRAFYNTVLGADLKEAHSDDTERLPVPATFIVNQDGVIVWRHFDPNYKHRASIADILRHVP